MHVRYVILTALILVSKVNSCDSFLKNVSEYIEFFFNWEQSLHIILYFWDLLTVQVNFALWSTWGFHVDLSWFIPCTEATKIRHCLCLQNPERSSSISFLSVYFVLVFLTLQLYFFVTCKPILSWHVSWFPATVYHVTCLIVFQNMCESS